MDYYLLIVAITVSIDSLFCGISLSCEKHFFKTSLKIISVVFAMCLIATYLGGIFKKLLAFNTEILGGFLFVFLAIVSLFLKKESSTEFFCLGFAIGLDGSCANFSLSLMGYTSFLVPLTLTFFHYLFLVIGYFLTKFKGIKKLSENKFLAPLVLAGLGIYKIIFAIL